MTAPKYISDCCLAPCFNVEGENGTCVLCGKECFACEEKKLEPLREWEKQKIKIHQERYDTENNKKS